MSFEDFFAFADCAARSFAEYHPRTTPESGALFRGKAVHALRVLWRSGSVHERAALASQVGLWMGRDLVSVRQLHERIRGRELDREIARLNGTRRSA